MHAWKCAYIAHSLTHDTRQFTQVILKWAHKRPHVDVWTNFKKKILKNLSAPALTTTTTTVATTTYKHPKMQHRFITVYSNSCANMSLRVVQDIVLNNSGGESQEAPPLEKYSCWGGAQDIGLNNSGGGCSSAALLLRKYACWAGGKNIVLNNFVQKK